MAFCGGNSPVTDEFPSQKPMTWSFDIFCDLGWVNNRIASYLWCGCTHYDVTVMLQSSDWIPGTDYVYMYPNSMELFLATSVQTIY